MAEREGVVHSTKKEDVRSSDVMLIPELSSRDGKNTYRASRCYLVYDLKGPTETCLQNPRKGSPCLLESVPLQVDFWLHFKNIRWEASFFNAKHFSCSRWVLLRMAHWDECLAIRNFVRWLIPWTKKSTQAKRLYPARIGLPWALTTCFRYGPMVKLGSGEIVRNCFILISGEWNKTKVLYMAMYLLIQKMHRI